MGPDFCSPAAPKTDTYSENKLPKQTASAPSLGEKAQKFRLGRDIPAEWWTLFHSKILNDLISQGIANSPTLEAAESALRQAQETAQASMASNSFPTLVANPSAIRQRFSNSLFGDTSTPPTIFNLYNTPVNVTYTFDLFGKGRREVESLCAQVDYQRFLMEGAYLTLAANIATTAITEASLRALIQATHRLIDLNKKEIAIAKKQYERGYASLVDLQSLETQAAEIRATLAPLEKNLAASRHLLYALVGALPGKDKLPDLHISDIRLPTTLPVSVASLLVRQRPDIRASEALLHQASADIGVATANLLPQLTITGSYSYQANFLDQLFKHQSSVWSYGPQLVQPIFDGGALRAKRRAAMAGFDQARAQYRQTVLQAFRNVADSLSALEIDANASKSQAEAEASAKLTLALVQKQCKAGLVNNLALLGSERQYLQVHINHIQAQALRYTDTVALFQSLGGGWWNRVPKECYCER